MDQKEVLKDECIERDKKFLSEHDTEFLTKPAYAPIKTRFNDKYDELQEAKQIQFEQTGYVTFDKGLLWKLIVESVLFWTDAGYLQAVELDKPELAKALNKEPSWLEQCAENVMIGRAKDLVNFLDTNSGTLTVITPAAVTAMTTTIQNFEDVAAMPKSIIKLKKADGTDVIPQLFKDFAVIKNQIKKFIRINFPAYLNGWNGINKIGKPSGSRRLSVAAKFVDSEIKTPLINVKATFTKGPLTEVKMSTKLGWVRGYSMEVGVWTMDVENVMYEPVKIENIGVEDTHVVRMEVKLVKKAGAPVVTGGFKVTAVSQHTGKKLAGLILSLPLIGKSYVSDVNGLFSDGAVAVNSYEGTISGTGVVSKEISLVVKGGEVVEMNVGVDDEV